MPGPFSKSNPPKRPGAYTNFVVRQQRQLIPSLGSVMAVPYVGSWGPVNTAVYYDRWEDWVAVNSDLVTPGYKAVYQAFKGEGIAGYPGAGQVIGVRMGGSDAAQASRVLTNTTPATAVTLKAIYPGTRGNKLGVVVQTNAVTNTLKDVVIYDGTVEVERYTTLAAGAGYLAALVDEINRRSNWIRATLGTDTIALATTGSAASPSTLSGGNDGATLTATEWTNAMRTLEPERFSIFAPYDLTDSAVLTSVATWTEDLNTKGKRIMTVVGGPSSDTLSTALARSLAFNSPNVLNLGIGTYIDEDFGELSTAQLAPRLGGILAFRNETRSLTLARLAGLLPGTGLPTESEILQTLDGGVIVISRDSHQVAPLRLELGRTTYTTRNNTDRPYEVYSNPKFVRTMGGFEMEITQFAEEEIITPSLPVNDDTRAFAVGRARQILARREAANIVQPGWSVATDNNPPPSPTDEHIALAYDMTFARTAVRVQNTVSVA